MLARFLFVSSNALIMKTLVKTSAPFLLITMFAYAVVSKLIIFDSFRLQLYRQPFAHAIAGALAIALPAAEIAAVILLTISRTRRQGLFLSFALLGAFTLYILLILSGYWEKIPCPCGGVLSHFSWAQHLLFNLAFLLVSIAGLWATVPAEVDHQSVDYY